MYSERLLYSLCRNNYYLYNISLVTCTVCSGICGYIGSISSIRSISRRLIHRCSIICFRIIRNRAIWISIVRISLVCTSSCSISRICVICVITDTRGLNSTVRGIVSNFINQYHVNSYFWNCETISSWIDLILHIIESFF